MKTRRVIRPALIENTRSFVTDMLTRIMKQSADDATIDRVTAKVLKALPSSVRFSG